MWNDSFYRRHDSYVKRRTHTRHKLETWLILTYVTCLLHMWHDSCMAHSYVCVHDPCVYVCVCKCLCFRQLEGHAYDMWMNECVWVHTSMQEHLHMNVIVFEYIGVRKNTCTWMWMCLSTKVYARTCACVCNFVCMHVCVRADQYICIYVWTMCVHVYHTCVRACVPYCRNFGVCVRACVCACVCVCMCVYVCVGGKACWGERNFLFDILQKYQRRSGVPPRSGAESLSWSACSAAAPWWEARCLFVSVCVRECVCKRERMRELVCLLCCSAMVRGSLSVCVCVWERECVCIYARERDRELVCLLCCSAVVRDSLWDWERERERARESEWVCWCVRKRSRLLALLLCRDDRLVVCVCVGGGRRECVRCM